MNSSVLYTEEQLQKSKNFIQDNIDKLEKDKKKKPENDEFLKELYEVRDKIHKKKNLQSLKTHEKEFLKLLHDTSDEDLYKIASDKNIKELKDLTKLILDNKLY